MRESVQQLRISVSGQARICVPVPKESAASVTVEFAEAGPDTRPSARLTAVVKRADNAVRFVGCINTYAYLDVNQYATLEIHDGRLYACISSPASEWIFVSTVMSEASVNP